MSEDEDLALDFVGEDHTRLDRPAYEVTGVQPNPKIPTTMFVRLSKTFHFEAAHDLPTFPPDHKCRRLHGHSFRFDVIVEGEVDPAKGYLIDYGDIKKAADPLVKRLDHYYLNEIEGLSNPTSEVLARWVFDRLKPALPQLSSIIVHETCTSSCAYCGR